MAPKKKLTKEEQEAERVRLEEEAKAAEQGMKTCTSFACEGRRSVIETATLRALQSI